MTPPSSETATTPLPLSSPISANSLPSNPFVMLPIGSTLAAPFFLVIEWIKATVSWLSMVGLVFGMQARSTNPPLAAALVPVSIVSASSFPGSRRWTCISIKPGETIFPLTSMTLSPLWGIFLPISAILPLSIRMSDTLFTPLDGSITRPPLSNNFIFSRLLLR